jgi:hypothetical protein
MRLTVRTLVLGLTVLAVFAAAPAGAQYRPYRAPGGGATGESWHVEFGIGTWSPGPVFTVNGANGAVAGVDVAAQGDLGLQGRLLKEFTLVLRPAKKHKFRFAYEPISYSASTALARTILFDGQTFASGATVATSVDWQSYKLGYEYDFIYRPRWFIGVVTEIRHDIVTVSLSNPPTTGSSRVRTPFPMIGGIVRIYPLSDVSLTAEITGMKLPSSVRNLTGYDGHAFDLDLYATFNFSNNIGIRSGYRSMNVYYEWATSHDDLTRRGPYVMGLLRF